MKKFKAHCRQRYKGCSANSRTLQEISSLKTEEILMSRSIALMLLVLGTSTVSMASVLAPVPEIDPTNGIAALALVAVAVLIIRGRRKKKQNAEGTGGICA
jgi:hypothetical protein